MSFPLPIQLRKARSQHQQQSGNDVKNTAPRTSTPLTTHPITSEETLSTREADHSNGDHTTPSPFDCLPIELKIEIFSYLPIKDMARVSKVNRTLHTLMTDKSNRNMLAKARIAASQERFKDSIREHDEIATLPFGAALERFFDNRGLRETPHDRYRAAFVFATLRHPYSQDRALVQQTTDLVDDLLALHVAARSKPIVRSPFHTSPPRLRLRDRFEFAYNVPKRYPNLKIPADELEYTHWRLTTGPSNYLAPLATRELPHHEHALSLMPEHCCPNCFHARVACPTMEAVTRALKLDLPVPHDILTYYSDDHRVRRKVRNAVLGDWIEMSLVQKAALLEEVYVFARM